MYSELLTTPHVQRIEGGLSSGPLLSSIDFAAVRERINAAQRLDTHLSQSFIESVDIAQVVHRTLAFQPNVDGSSDFTPIDIARNQATNCHGHTVVLSELLCEADINHVIAYANGHSFVVLSDYADRTYMVDATTPYLTGDISNAVHSSDIRDVPEQIRKYGLGAARLRTDMLVESNAGLVIDVDTLAIKHQWLSKNKRKVLGSGRGRPFFDGVSRKKYEQDHTIIATLYVPYVGAEAISHFERFRHSLAIGKLASAYKHLAALSGRFPELDSALPKDDVESFILGLARKGYVALAISATESVASTFRPDISSDIVLQSWRGDVLRDIGRISRRAQIIDDAIESYKNIQGSTNRSHIKGKVEKSMRIRNAI